MLASVSASALGPATVRAGSLGITKASRNVRKLTPIRIPRLAISRCAILVTESAYESRLSSISEDIAAAVKANTASEAEATNQATTGRVSNKKRSTISEANNETSAQTPSRVQDCRTDATAVPYRRPAPQRNFAIEHPGAFGTIVDSNGEGTYLGCRRQP
jgi:hypothetical protein